jgi:hypothetical protein
MTDAEETTFTAKQLARKLNTDPKSLRKFLRSKDSPVEAVGQGGRYEFDADAAKLIAASFKNWGGVKPTKLKTETDSIVDAVDDALEVLEEVEDEPKPKPKAPRKPRAKKGVEPEIVEDAVEELEELEPDAEELEELEDLDDLFDELDD